MDWFEQLTGFKELDYAATRSRLQIRDERLHSSVNGRSWSIGRFELVSLGELRKRSPAPSSDRNRLATVTGDVGKLHTQPEFGGALFQVASQFNALEMVGPDVTPEMGVTRYQFDRTQGPACAIAAGAATVYRNYFVPVGGQSGQTRDVQLDGLASLGARLASMTGLPVDRLWAMRNGYALCSRYGLEAIGRVLSSASQTDLDALRSEVCVGLHWDVEVTALGTREPSSPGPLVSQAFCSALPVAYSELPAGSWTSFARLVLEAAYEATLLAGACNAARGRSSIVLLTHLGGGAFGNRAEWIDGALRRALAKAGDCGLDIRIVSYGRPDSSMVRFVEEHGSAGAGG